MVVLSKLATDFYESLRFKNRTTGIYFTKYVLQVTANKYKIEEDFKKFLKPKFLNLSSFGIDINDKKSSDAFQIFKEIKKTESKKGTKKQEQIEEKKKDLENSFKQHMSKPQTWHISGTIKIKAKYNKVSKTGKTYIYFKEERDGIMHKGTKDEAIYVFRKSMIQKY
jgi:hypothetical protein